MYERAIRAWSGSLPSTAGKTLGSPLALRIPLQRDGPAPNGRARCVPPRGVDRHPDIKHGGHEKAASRHPRRGPPGRGRSGGPSRHQPRWRPRPRRLLAPIPPGGSRARPRSDGLHPRPRRPRRPLPHIRQRGLCDLARRRRPAAAARLGHPGLLQPVQPASAAAPGPRSHPGRPGPGPVVRQVHARAGRLHGLARPPARRLLSPAPGHSPGGQVPAVPAGDQPDVQPLLPRARDRDRLMALRIRITLLYGLTLLAGAACATAASGATLAVPTSTALVQRQDIAQRQSVQGTITFADPVGIQALTIPPEVLTALPAPGTVVDRGQQLYRVGAQPVVLMLGTTPAWRRMAEGCSGADVKELEENLIALGFAGSGLSANGVFDQADVAAVRRWQASLGVPQDGTVSLGVIEFLPTPVRVTAVHAQLGALPPAGGGQSGGALLDVTSTKQVVTVDLDTAYLASVKAGNLVSVLLPDNRTQAQGTVSSVGSVATVAPAPQG